MSVLKSDDILEVGALGFINRGFDMMVRPSMNKALHETTCISCGNCIEICPTGAIDYHLPFAKPGPWTTEEEVSVCSYCGVGCDLDESGCVVGLALPSHKMGRGAFTAQDTTTSPATAS